MAFIIKPKYIYIKVKGGIHRWAGDNLKAFKGEKVGLELRENGRNGRGKFMVSGRLQYIVEEELDDHIVQGSDVHTGSGHNDYCFNCRKNMRACQCESFRYGPEAYVDGSVSPQDAMEVIKEQAGRDDAMTHELLTRIEKAIKGDGSYGNSTIQMKLTAGISRRLDRMTRIILWLGVPAAIMIGLDFILDLQWLIEKLLG